MRFHDQYCRSNRTILSVVGDVSVSDLKRGLAAHIGAWQTGGSEGQAAIEAVLMEMRRTREQPVNDTELNDAKAFLTGSFPLRLDTNGKIARLLANIEYCGLGVDYTDRFPGLVNAVTVADVQRVAQRSLDLDRYALAVVADLRRAKIKD